MQDVSKLPLNFNDAVPYIVLYPGSLRTVGGSDFDEKDFCFSIVRAKQRGSKSTVRMCVLKSSGWKWRTLNKRRGYLLIYLFWLEEEQKGGRGTVGRNYILEKMNEWANQ